jgi:hypothetical protein
MGWPGCVSSRGCGRTPCGWAARRPPSARSWPLTLTRARVRTSLSGAQDGLGAGAAAQAVAAVAQPGPARGGAGTGGPPLPTRTGRRAAEGAVSVLPPWFARTLTWDRGMEMARHQAPRRR